MKEELKNADDHIRNYEFSEIEDDPRFLVINKEVKFAYILWTVFAILSLAAIYGLGGGDPVEYTYVMGLPLWFFAYLTIVIGFIVLITYVVKKKFRNMDLD